MRAVPAPAPTWRPATEADIEFMVDLFLALAVQRHPGGRGVDVEAIAEGTRSDTLKQVQGKVENSVTYVIELDEVRVGRLRVVRTEGLLEIAGIQIRPEYQGRGIGTRVISALMQEGRSRGVATTLEVDKDNPDARGLYLRLGFRASAETDTNYRMTASGGPSGS